MFLPVAFLSLKAVVDHNPTVSGNCSPSRVHFTGRITTDAAGPVRYTWVRSRDRSSATFVLNFDKPGTLPVTYDWLVHGPTDGWVVLQVVSPLAVHSEKVRFDVSCKQHPR
jgi:hypothetical protein